MITLNKKSKIEATIRHIARLDEALRRRESLDRRFPWLRMAGLLGGGLLTYLAFVFGPPRLGWVIAALAVAAFSMVVAAHRRLDRSRLRFQIARRLASIQLARMTLDWEQIPLSPATSANLEEHPFAFDLNLVGERSLHQLVDTAISTGGSRRLLEWFLATTPDPEQIASSQALVKELLLVPGFRQRLAFNGALVSSDSRQLWDGEKLLAWLDAHPAGQSLRNYLLLLGSLSTANIILLVLNLLGLLPPYWLVTLGIYGFLQIFKYHDYSELFEEAYSLSLTLNSFRAVLAYLETYPYPQDSRLSRLCAVFWAATRRPSLTLEKVSRIASAASLQRNQFLSLIINAIVPWDLTFAHLLYNAKQEIRSLLPTWLEAWYELEALVSLANFGASNPEATFPELLPAGQAGPLFEAHALGHPLLADEVRVCNDFSFQHLGEIALITGSNMSGKSTFLRTLGVNLCLAYAGGPVFASHLRALPFRVFTCITVSDSLNNGISYFYAEVRRLKALLQALETPSTFPLFFLIDEIFRGTNNRERHIGSQAYVHALAGGGGVGAISTHDLELVELSEEVPGLINYHFREDVSQGRMVFDYHLRPGPCPTTNALKIMALEGLPVRVSAAD